MKEGIISSLGYVITGCVKSLTFLQRERPHSVQTTLDEVTFSNTLNCNYYVLKISRYSSFA